MYVCMYYVCMYVCLYVCMYVCVRDKLEQSAQAVKNVRLYCTRILEVCESPESVAD